MLYRALMGFPGLYSPPEHYLPHMKAQAVRFNRGFLWKVMIITKEQVAEKISFWVKVKKFRSVYAHIVQSAYAVPTGCDRCDSSVPNPRRRSMETEDPGTSGSISREIYHSVAVE
jgi:hypothetical protein